MYSIRVNFVRLKKAREDGNNFCVVYHVSEYPAGHSHSSGERKETFIYTRVYCKTKEVPENERETFNNGIRLLYCVIENRFRSGDCSLADIKEDFK